MNVEASARNPQTEPDLAEPDLAEPGLAEAGQAAEDAQFYRGVLHELLEIGTQVARTVGAQARARNAAAVAPDRPPSPAPDLTIPFDRIARAMRRTIALARKLAEEPPAPSAAPARHRAAARKRILREVEDVIQRKSRDAEAESLHAELDERLDAPDLDEEIASRPVAEIIADICRDLGIAHPPGTHPWKRRTPADIAELCARAARSRPASPGPLAASAADSGRPEHRAVLRRGPPSRDGP